LSKHQRSSLKYKLYKSEKTEEMEEKRTTLYFTCLWFTFHTSLWIAADDHSHRGEKVKENFIQCWSHWICCSWFCCIF